MGEYVIASGAEHLMVDGEGPSKAGLEALEARGGRVWIKNFPDSGPDLRFLACALEAIEELYITHLVRADLNLISEMPRLRKLSTRAVPIAPVDLSQLPFLEIFRGEHRGFESLSDGMALRQLSIERPHSDGLHFRGPVRVLELLGAGRIRRLPTIVNSSSLVAVTVDGARELSLAELPSYSSLTMLHLHLCRELSDAEGLLSVRKRGGDPWQPLPDGHRGLKGISIRGCREVRPLMELLRLEDVSLVIEKSPAFSQAFQDAAIAAGLADWDFTRA